MPHGILEWDLDSLQHAMHLNVDDVRAYFTDGRRVSFMLERRLMREVLGGRFSASEGDDHDLVDAQGKKWEVRSVSGGGIYFCPSYMVGSGRRFECDGFLRKLGIFTGRSFQTSRSSRRSRIGWSRLQLSANGGTTENWPRPPRLLDVEPLSSCRRCHELEPTRSV